MLDDESRGLGVIESDRDQAELAIERQLAALKVLQGLVKKLGASLQEENIGRIVPQTEDNSVAGASGAHNKGA